MTLKVENLNVSIAQQPILQDLSLDFAAGRRTAIVGPNGAGKSTLLRAVAGLNHDYTGSICLDGQEIRQLARQHMALHHRQPVNHVRELLDQLDQQRGLGVGFGFFLLPVPQGIWAGANTLGKDCL